MRRDFVKKTATVLSMAAIIGSQTLSVCAAPANIPVVSKENLLRYYEDNFDVAKYKATYKDLRDAFGENADDSVYLNHYLQYGMTEGRKSGGFDAIAFIINNYDYFMEHGMESEFPFFDVQKYKDTYPDLQVAFGDDLSAYLNHYLTFGIYEDRTSGGEVDIIQMAKLNPNMDLSSNIDLSKAPEIVTQVAQQIKTAETKRVETVKAAQQAATEQTVFLGGTVVKDTENKVYYNYEAYNKAVQNWIQSEPYIDAYLAETDYFEHYWAWESRKPDINNYLTEAGQEAYNTWMDAQPDYWTYLMQTGFKDEYEAWENEIPQRNDFTVGYENEAAAQDAFEADHADWVASEPKQENFVDMEAYVAVRTAWEAREPKETQYPFFEDGYSDEVAAREAYQDELERWEANKPVAATPTELEAAVNAWLVDNAEPQAEDFGDDTSAYEAAHAKWLEDKTAVGTETPEELQAKIDAWVDENAAPVETDYTSKVNKYETQLKATEAFVAAQNTWLAEEPQKADYPDTDAFDAAYAEWEASEPTIDNGDYELGDYATEEEAEQAYKDALDEHSYNQPVGDAYIIDTTYTKDYNDWLEAEPDLSEEFVQDDEGNDYQDVITDWEAEEPNYEEYLDDTTFEADHQEWVETEPKLEDFTNADGSVG